MDSVGGKEVGGEDRNTGLKKIGENGSGERYSLPACWEVCGVV